MEDTDKNADDSFGPAEPLRVQDKYANKQIIFNVKKVRRVKLVKAIETKVKNKEFTVPLKPPTPMSTLSEVKPS